MTLLSDKEMIRDSCITNVTKIVLQNYKKNPWSCQAGTAGTTYRGTVPSVSHMADKNNSYNILEEVEQYILKVLNIGRTLVVEIRAINYLLYR